MGKEVNDIKQTCIELLKTLSLKEKEVVSRRFGLEENRTETLELIGKDFGVTRERIRQVEKAAFLKLEPEIKKHQKTFDYFKKEIKKTGNLRKEEALLSELGGRNLENEVYFLLTLEKDFKRFGETKEFHSLWTIDGKSWDFAQKTIKSVCEKFKKTKKLLKTEELGRSKTLTPEVFESYLEISKEIQKNQENFWGLKTWPEINPKTIRDKTYLVFKKTQKPLHFSQAADLIGLALPQTVHNELIKDPRFILIGRGTYALREWGYREGLVKDVLLDILKKAEHPLKKEVILEKVLEQRMVKENTVLLNLSNKKYFSKTPEGYYKIREA